MKSVLQDSDKYNENVENICMCSSHDNTRNPQEQPCIVYKYPVEPNVCAADLITDWVLRESVGDE